MPLLIVSVMPGAQIAPPQSAPGISFRLDRTMTRQEADDFIGNYRALLKAWTFSVAGFSAQDSDALHQRLEAGQDQLADIALQFPEKSYSIDMLINARSRSWAGWTADRPARPADRSTQ